MMSHPSSLPSTPPDSPSRISPLVASQARLPSVLTRFQEQMRRIDGLERRINCRAVKTRRRITNLLDQSAGSSSRPSHLRLFITHQYHTNNGNCNNNISSSSNNNNQLLSYPQTTTTTTAPPVTAFGGAHAPSAFAGQQQQQQQQQQLSSKTSAVSVPLWTLQIEGKLLIGHLDHASASRHDERTGYTPPTDDLDRSKGEPEETQVKPVQFTHFFDKVIVRFQTIYQPKPNPMAAPNSPSVLKMKAKLADGTGKASAAPPPKSSKKKSSRRSSGTGAAAAAKAEKLKAQQHCAVDPSLLTRSRHITELVWTKSSSDDAHAFRFQCQAAPPPSHLMVHSLVANIELYPASAATAAAATAGGQPPSASFGIGSPASPLTASSRQQELDACIYQVSPALAAALFPSHGKTSATAETTSSESRKRKAEEDATTGAQNNNAATSLDPSSMSPVEDTSSSAGAIPTEQEINIRSGLTMKEITQAFFVYIRDHRLYDERDKSLVNCDKTLEELFRTEQFPFSNIRQLLLSHDLVRNISQEPHRFTYILKAETATNYQPRQHEGKTEIEENVDDSSLLQIDMDVSVPALFPYRARQLLRRIKRRELEYTSSRTKARYVLMSRRARTGEEAVKTQIDLTVTGRHGGGGTRNGSSQLLQSLDSESLRPVQQALARSAPPRTEARMAVHYDTRMSYLLGRLRERQRAALDAWDVVQSLES